MDFSNIEYVDACKYSNLHKKIFGVTSTHVVFSELSTVSVNQVEEFNKIISFAHYSNAKNASATNPMNLGFTTVWILVF